MADDTRQIVERFLTARAEQDADTITALLHPDAEWHTPQSVPIGPFVGRDDVAAALGGGAAGKLLKVETIERDVHALFVDGDTAIALQRLKAEMHSGDIYENEYVWIYRVKDGLVIRMDEHVDSLHAARLGLLPLKA